MIKKGYCWIASEIEQNITPYFANFSLKVVAIETLSKTASIATFDNCFCSLIEIPNFSNVFRISGSTSSSEFNCFYKP